ncbi:MAG: ArsR/SmtB family transcription factor [Spirochaetota bacterium]
MILEQLKALADPTRLTLLAVLFDYELTVNELVSVLGMGQSRVSRHLKILLDASLIRNRRDGLFIYYYYHESPESEICMMLQERIRPYLTGSLRKRCTDVLTERRERTKRFFNSIADKWTELKRDIIGSLDLYGSILSMLRSYDIRAIADLGCGNGDFCERLAGAYTTVIGVDNSPEMIRLACSRFDEQTAPDFRIGAIEHLPMRDNEVDCAVLILVLHHLSDPGEGLSEIRRTIRDGGYFVLVDFDRHDNRELHERYGDLWPGFTRNDLSKQLSACGFSVLDYSGYPVSHDLNIHLYLAKKHNVIQKETV